MYNLIIIQINLKEAENLNMDACFFWQFPYLAV
jgi:hypothetical protein